MPKILNTGSISFSTLKTYFGTNSNIGSIRGLASEVPLTGAFSFSALRNQIAPSTPIAWYDARSTFTLSYDAANKVRQWRDKSGCNYHINQSVAAQQPTFSNNGFDGTRPSIILPQGTSLATWASNMGTLASNTPYTIFCVAENNSTIPFAYTVGTFTLSDGSVAPSTDCKFQMSLNNNTVNSNTVQLFGNKLYQGQPTYSGKCIQGLSHGGVTNYSYLLLNNNLPVSLSNYNDIPSLLSSGTQFTVGNSSNTANRNVPKIAEVLMYDNELSIYERLSTERYLTEKWGLFPIDMAGLAANVTGVYCPKRMVASYKGPTVRLRRGNDNAELDFYSDCFGTLGSQYNGEGRTLLSWGSNMLLYVRTLYDQSGRNNHATQTTTGNQPFFSPVNYSIDFGTTSNQFLTITGTPVAVDDPAYSIIFRHGQFNNTTDGGFMSFGDGSASSTFTIRANNASYATDKGGTAYTFGSLSNTLPTTVTVQKSANSTVTGYVNGVQFTSTSTSLITPFSNTTYIGRTIGGKYINGQLFFVVITNSDISSASRISLEQNTTTSSYSEKILNSFPTYQRYDASTIPSQTTSVSTWVSSHNDGGTGRNAIGAGTTLPTYGSSNSIPEVQFMSSSNQHFSIGTLNYGWMNSNGGITIAVCAKFTNPVVNQALYEISNNTAAATNYSMIFKTGPSTTSNIYDISSIITNGASTVNNVTTPGAVIDRDYHIHVACINTSTNGTVTRVYTDGMVNTGNTNAQVLQNRSTIYNYIGRGINVQPRYFDGSLRDLIIYQVPLSHNNALAVANALALKWGMPRRYPPASLISAGVGLNVSTTLQNMPYGNGTYVIRATSAYTSITNPVSAFDGTYTDARWISGAGTYQGNAGTYLGSQSTLVDGIPQAGEWIQLQIPDSIVPSHFLLVENNQLNAISLVIAGSNDGVSWTSLYDATDRIPMNTIAPYTLIKASTSSSYTYYRYICRLKNTSYAQAYHALFEFAIFGY